MKKIFFTAILLCGFNISAGFENTQADLLKSFGIGVASSAIYSSLRHVKDFDDMFSANLHLCNTVLVSTAACGALGRKINLFDLQASSTGGLIGRAGHSFVCGILEHKGKSYTLKRVGALMITGALIVGSGKYIYDAIKNSSTKKTTPEIPLDVKQ